MRTQEQQSDYQQRGAPDAPAQMDAMRFWLASGIHRFALDPRRRLGGHGRARQMLTDDRPAVPVSTEVWRALASTLDRHTVLGGMTELNPEERRVIMLAYLEGRTNREIAAVLGVSVGTVGRRLQTALKRLDSYIGRTGSWLSAILLLGAGYLVAAATRLGRSASVAGSADWTHKLASTVAVGAVATAAIAATAIVPHSTRPERSSTPATVHADVAVPRTGTALSPVHQAGLAPAPRTVVVVADRSRGSGQDADANTQKANDSHQGDQGNGGNSTNAPPAVPVGPPTNHPHGRPVGHPPVADGQD